MRQLLVAFVAAAAFVASQNSAQAVFEKVIIDDFSTPAAQFTGSTENISGQGGLAETRELAGDPFLSAGSGAFFVNIVTANTTAELIYVLSSPIVDPLLHLTNLNATGGTGSLLVEAFLGGNSLGALEYTGTDDKTLSWYLGDPPPGETDLRFEFTAVDGTFQGSADKVVANPEPATMALMGLGVLGGAIGYRRRRKDDEVAPVEA